MLVFKRVRQMLLVAARQVLRAVSTAPRSRWTGALSFPLPCPRLCSRSNARLTISLALTRTDDCS